jgi:hypothetical protein
MDKSSLVAPDQVTALDSHEEPVLAIQVFVDALLNPSAPNMAERLCSHYGFAALPQTRRRFLLPMAAIAELFR